MTRDLSRFSKTTYDLLIVGGGINGAAIANIAAGRGLSVALIEKNDFGSGTSSKSTKLIHGGIRYLEHFEFDLVYESLRERTIQLKSAPHLVQPLKFVIPVYKNDKRPLWMMRLGVFLYDFLAGKYKVGNHKHLTKKDILQLAPEINPDGLAGGVLYYDAQMDDARLCLENVLSAAHNGADVANYVAAAGFLKENGKVVGVKARDSLTGLEFEIKAKQTVCTVGPWTNTLLRMDDASAKKKLRTTKGIHIVYKGQFSESAFFIPSQSDKRIFFVIPWLGNSLIGTTDTDAIDKPEEAKADDADIEYLFCEASRVFPKANFSRENIITTFAGLRPLVRRGGTAPSNVTRKHVIFKTESGLSFVIGGKYTTYRRIAQECVNTLTRTRPHPQEKEFPLFGSGTIEDGYEHLAAAYGIPMESTRALLEKYGTRTQDVLKLLLDDPSLKEPICSCTPFIRAQIVYALKTEMAQTAEDIVERRLSLSYIPCQYQNCRKIIAEIIKEYCG